MKVLPVSSLCAASCAALGLMGFACASSGSGNSNSSPRSSEDGGASSTSGGGGGAMPAPSGNGGTPAPSGGPTGAGPIEGDGGAASTPADAAPPASDGPAEEASPGGGAKPPRALVYTLSNGGHLLHPSIEPAKVALHDALTPLGFAVDLSVDPTKFTAASLQDYTVVVMISSSGSPFGIPGTDGMNALTSFVRAGGGLVGVHSASLVDYAPTSTFVALLGGKFSGHPGAVHDSTCQAVGTHPSVAKLANPYLAHDEIYTFVAPSPDDQIDLHCAGLAAGEVLPIAWHRTEGKGRVFYTGLGHGPELWTTTTAFFTTHVLPAVLWAAGR